MILKQNDRLTLPYGQSQDLLEFQLVYDGLKCVSLKNESKKTLYKPMYQIFCL